MKDKPDVMPAEPESEDQQTADKGTGFLSVVHSVLAAGLGVQSSKNRARDFQQGRAVHFIVGGVLGTVLFVIAIVVFVNVIIRTA
jgi:hypothetical protein